MKDQMPALLLAMTLAAFASASSPLMAQTSRLGMTWAKASHDDAKGVDVVSCHGGGKSCEAHKGDTPCSESLPVLCVRKSAAANPGVPTTQYAQWASGHIATTMPVPGFALLSQQAGDGLCLATQGPGWRMAEFHDGWGWGFAAFGNVRDDTRFWVRINDQKANCWDP
jgi:hypothetical protein